MTKEGHPDSVWKRATARPAPRDYKHIMYNSYDDGISIITLNRPDKLNAFNREMKEELKHALWERFNSSLEERALIIKGYGEQAFSTGEDLAEINLEWNTFETSRYVKETLTLYHDIVRGILCSTKPIIAAINGTAAGAALSIAMACDERFAVRGFSTDENEHKYRYHCLIPGFATLGLVADSGITVTLPKFVGVQLSQKWLETPKFKIEILNVFIGTTIFHHPHLHTNYTEMIKDVTDFIHQEIFTRSSSEYAANKERRNHDTLRSLTSKGGVFEWEINAQTSCMRSDFTRQKIREFQKKSNG